MSRFVTPLLFAAAAVYVGWYNGQHTDRVLLFPGMDLLIPGGDIAAQGMMTVKVLAGLAVVFGIWGLVGYVRERGAEAG